MRNNFKHTRSLMYFCKYCGQEFDNKYKLTGHTVHCKSNPDVYTEYTCEFCGQAITGKHKYTQHVNHCEHNPQKVVYKSTVRAGYTDKPALCKFCSKLCKNDNSLRNHERLCAKNPDRRLSCIGNLSNQGWSKGLTKETDSRIAKQSKALAIFYAEHPEAITGGIVPGSAKRCKYGTYKGFYCDSAWELAFVVYHLDHGINIIRNVEAFSYLFESKEHKYYPDFKVADIYYEVKGICTERDLLKFDAFPHKESFQVIDKKAIKPYLQYMYTTYGKDFAEKLYDRSKPCWLDVDHKALKKYNFNPIDI